MPYFIIFLLTFLTGCEQTPKPNFQEGEYLFRHANDHYYQLQPPQVAELVTYPWEKQLIGHFPPITKYHFRCKGSLTHPLKKITPGGETFYLEDCGGKQAHSLPLVDKEEHIYPILIKLLNHIQEKTEHKVVITSGHHCPTHHKYLTGSNNVQPSKHLIGAEVTFYVQEMEQNPYLIIQLIQNYYAQDAAPFKKFERYTKEGGSQMTAPWFNKEIFIKLITAGEGRNEDNRHAYPYIAIQVRWDREKKESVTYSWPAAQNYYRY